MIHSQVSSAYGRLVVNQLTAQVVLLHAVKADDESSCPARGTGSYKEYIGTYLRGSYSNMCDSYTYEEEETVIGVTVDLKTSFFFTTL